MAYLSTGPRSNPKNGTVLQDFTTNSPTANLQREGGEEEEGGGKEGRRRGGEEEGEGGGKKEREGRRGGGGEEGGSMEGATMSIVLPTAPGLELVTHHEHLLVG